MVVKIINFIKKLFEKKKEEEWDTMLKIMKRYNEI